MEKLKTQNEWIDIMADRGIMGHWVALEQACYQSIKHKVCVECLGEGNLILKDKRALIKSTDYYLCKECDEYYNNK